MKKLYDFYYIENIAHYYTLLVYLVDVIFCPNHILFILNYYYYYYYYLISIIIRLLSEIFNG
jgi:hypothetical protein